MEMEMAIKSNVLQKQLQFPAVQPKHLQFLQAERPHNSPTLALRTTLQPTNQLNFVNFVFAIFFLLVTSMA